MVAKTKKSTREVKKIIVFTIVPSGKKRNHIFFQQRNSCADNGVFITKVWPQKLVLGERLVICINYCEEKTIFFDTREEIIEIR